MKRFLTVSAAAALAVLFAFAPSAKAVVKPETKTPPATSQCKYTVEQVQRICMDSIYDSPVEKRRCYRRLEDDGCREIFAACIHNCTFRGQAAKESEAGESAFAKLLKARIANETKDDSCKRDADCGVIVLLDDDGCRSFHPASFASANEKTMAQLLNAYNKMQKLTAEARGGKSMPKCAPVKPGRPFCKKAAGKATGVCGVKG
jgi:hypothetical protein